MQLLYNLAAILVVIIIIPVFAIRSIREKGFVERIKQSLGFFPDGARFAATLKMVGRSVTYLDYELDIGTSGIMFENSEGYSGEVTPEGTPIEWNMSQYIAENYLWR